MARFAKMVLQCVSWVCVLYVCVLRICLCGLLVCRYERGIINACQVDTPVSLSLSLSLSPPTYEPLSKSLQLCVCDSFRLHHLFIEFTILLFGVVRSNDRTTV